MPRSLWLLICCLLLLPTWGAGSGTLQQRLARADACLAQAEQQPAKSAPLVKEASDLVPAGACPALKQAANSPSKETLAKARNEVNALQQSVKLQPASPPGLGQEHKALESVLARSEFGSVQKGSLLRHTPNWLSRIFRAIGNAIRVAWQASMRFLSKIFRTFGNFLSKIMRKLFGNIHYSPSRLGKMGKSTRTLLFALLLLAAIFLIGFIISRLVIYYQRREELRKAEVTGDSPGARGAGIYVGPWDQALQEAESLWTAGLQREALRVVLRACLVLLDNRGVLRYDESRANGEVLRELRRLGRTELHGQFRTIVRSFDRSWYGFLEVSGDEFSTVIDTSRKVRTLVTGES